MRSDVWQLCTVLLICAKTTITHNLLKLLLEGSWWAQGEWLQVCSERMGGVSMLTDVCTHASQVTASLILQPLLGVVRGLPSCPHDGSFVCVVLMSASNQHGALNPMQGEEVFHLAFTLRQ